jgi:hypothetical protein
MKRTFCLSLTCLTVAFSLSGCFKEKEDFTLNPDGSGKVTAEIQVTLPQMGQAVDVAAEARKAVQNIVNLSEGVTAWKDVTFSGGKDGKEYIKGTAYFKDITKFKLAGENTSVQWKPVADGAVRMQFVFELPPEHAPAAASKLTEEEIAQKIAESKESFSKQVPMMTGMLKDLRAEWTFALPTAPDKTVNFEKLADRPNTVRVLIEGPKALDALKALANDDALLRAKIVAGKDPTGPPDPELLNEKLFGTKGPITVTFKPGDKPLFDFAAESEAAKKAMPEMLKELEAPVPAAK